MTRKELYNITTHVINNGYCGLQNVNCQGVKIGSNAGVYGWNWNAYLHITPKRRAVIVVDGYRNGAGVRAEWADKYDTGASYKYQDFLRECDERIDNREL